MGWKLCLESKSDEQLQLLWVFGVDEDKGAKVGVAEGLGVKTITDPALADTGGLVGAKVGTVVGAETGGSFTTLADSDWSGTSAIYEVLLISCKPASYLSIVCEYCSINLAFSSLLVTWEIWLTAKSVWSTNSLKVSVVFLPWVTSEANSLYLLSERVVENQALEVGLTETTAKITFSKDRFIG